MRSLLFVSLTARVVFSLIISNSINDLLERSDFELFQDMTFTSQNSPEDILVLNGSNDETNLFVNDDNDNLFANLDGTTDSASVDDFDANYFDLAEASPSCHSETDGGQSFSKIRTRDEICQPNNQPSSDISDFVNNAVGIFRNPFDEKGDETQRMLSTTEQPDQFCERRFPNRLCCETQGELGTTDPVTYPPGLSPPVTYKTFDKCQTRT